MGPIKVFHVEDYQIMRDGIKYLLSRDENIKIVGQACSGEQMVTRIKSIEVDVVIADLYLDGMENVKQMNGFDICNVLKQEYPHIKIVVHSAFEDADKVAKVIKAGALGFVSKKSGFEELINAVKMVHEGNIYICDEISLKLKNLNNFLAGIESNLRSKDEIFSAREKEILSLLGEGKSSKEIGKILFITERTVETHRKNMIEKAHMKNTVELIAYAASVGLIKK